LSKTKTQKLSKIAENYIYCINVIIMVTYTKSLIDLLTTLWWQKWEQLLSKWQHYGDI